MTAFTGDEWNKISTNTNVIFTDVKITDDQITVAVSILVNQKKWYMKNAVFWHMVPWSLVEIYFCALKIEAALSFESSVRFHHRSRHHNPEHSSQPPPPATQNLNCKEVSFYSETFQSPEQVLYLDFVLSTGHGGRRSPGTHPILCFNDTGYNLVLFFRQPEGSRSCMQTFRCMASRGWGVRRYDICTTFQKQISHMTSSRKQKRQVHANNAELFWRWKPVLNLSELSGHVNHSTRQAMHV